MLRPAAPSTSYACPLRGATSPGGARPWRGRGGGADAAPQHEGMLPGPTSQPSPLPPVGNSGVDSSWAGDICSTFCGSNQVPRTPAGTSGKDAALQSEGPSGAGAHDGTSSSGGSGSNYGGSGLPSDSVHVHKRKGRCRDDSDSPSEVSTLFILFGWLYNLYPERTTRK